MHSRPHTFYKECARAVPTYRCRQATAVAQVAAAVTAAALPVAQAAGFSLSAAGVGGLAALAIPCVGGAILAVVGSVSFVIDLISLGKQLDLYYRLNQEERNGEKGAVLRNKLKLSLLALGISFSITCIGLGMVAFELGTGGAVSPMVSLALALGCVLLGLGRAQATKRLPFRSKEWSRMVQWQDAVSLAQQQQEQTTIKLWPDGLEKVVSKKLLERLAGADPLPEGDALAASLQFISNTPNVDTAQRKVVSKKLLERLTGADPLPEGDALAARLRFISNTPDVDTAQRKVVSQKLLERLTGAEPLPEGDALAASLEFISNTPEVDAAQRKVVSQKLFERLAGADPLPEGDALAASLEFISNTPEVDAAQRKEVSQKLLERLAGADPLQEGNALAASLQFISNYPPKEQEVSFKTIWTKVSQAIEGSSGDQKNLYRLLLEVLEELSSHEKAFFLAEVVQTALCKSTEELTASSDPLEQALRDDESFRFLHFFYEKWKAATPSGADPDEWNQKKAAVKAREEGAAKNKWEPSDEIRRLANEFFAAIQQKDDFSVVVRAMRSFYTSLSSGQKLFQNASEGIIGADEMFPLVIWLIAESNLPEGFLNFFGELPDEGSLVKYWCTMLFSGMKSIDGPQATEH